MNLPASRLSALWLVLAAVPLGLSPGAALATVRRDAGYHRSPNAGWPEAAMAGALGIRLSGPRIYDGVAVEERWVGDGNSDARRARHPAGAETLSHGLRSADCRAGRDRAFLQALSPVGSREASTRARIQRREGQHRISMIGMRHSDSADSVCDGSP